MPFPLSITIYDAGPGGIPTTTNPRNLAGWVEDYSDSTVTNFGHESLRITGTVRSREDAADWTQRLISPIEVYTPTGKLHFSGFLNGVSVPALDVDMSLTNMANVVIVRWGDPDGKQGTVTVTNAASIARYGRKERVLNESISLEADATNRATMILTQIAEPPNKETVTTERGDGPFTVTLVICGWAETLKWLTMSSTTETTQASTTQVTGLLTAYNAINAFFDLTGASITATGHAATQFCPPDTTYYDRIDKLLSYGDTSQRRITWGFYGRAITIAVAAASTPDTITYDYSKRAGTLWDANGNVIPPWDWAPDVMVQNVDVIGPTPPTGAIASLTRKYIRRATLKIGKDGLPSGTLEPDDVDSLAEWVANPVSKNTGFTQRHQIADTRIRDSIGSRTIRTDNNNLWNPVIGVLRPEAGGTGRENTGTIDTGGGDIVFDPGGGTGLTGGGASPNLAKWSGASSLTNAISGTDYAPAHAHPYAATSHDHPHTDITDWNEAVDDRVGALLVEGTNITLTYNDTANTLTVASTGGGTVDGSGAATRVAYWSDADTLTSSANLTYSSDQLNLAGANNSLQLFERDGAGSWHMYANSSTWRLYSGSDLVTVSTAGTITAADDTIVLGGFTLDLDGSLRVSGTGAALGEVLRHDGTLFVSAVLVSTDISNFNEAVDDRVDALMVDSATIVWTYTDASNTLSAAVTGVPTGSGSADRLAIWSSASALTYDTSLYYDATDNQIGIGTTSPIGNFHAKRTDGEYQFIAESSSAKYGMACSSTFFVIDDVISWPTTARRFTIDSTGQIGIAGNGNPAHDLHMGSDSARKTTTTTWSTDSDARTKTILGRFSLGLDFLAALPPVAIYERNGRFGMKQGEKGVGFVAQELETVAPGWIERDMRKEWPDDPDGSEQEFLGVNQHELTYVHTNSILELDRRLAAVERQLGIGG